MTKKLVPLSEFLEEGVMPGEGRIALRLMNSDLVELGKLARRYSHSLQSILEMSLNEFLARRGIAPIASLSGKLNREVDELRDWPEGASAPAPAPKGRRPKPK